MGLAAAVAFPAAAHAAPYKDVSQHLQAAEPRMRVAAEGSATVALPSAAQHGGRVIWAFATGECGSERWGDFDTERFAALNVAAYVAAGVDYVLSTGGEAGAFTCASAEGMARFIARYDSPRLKGVDFDIERKQTPEQIEALAARAAELERSRPGLALSFTLATHAGSDAARRHLNDTGRTVLTALRRQGVKHAIVNLMVMNYGPADTRWCRLRAPRPGVAPACDMGRSALQAAANLHDGERWPYRQIALTVMLGENDVAGNVFGLDDAAVAAAGAKRLKLAGLHWWSLDRDRPCPEGSPRVAPQCHGLPGVAPGAFGRALAGAGGP